MNKFKLIIFACLLFLALISSPAFAKEETIVSLPGHELGDSTFSITAGVIFPLFVQDFSGKIEPVNKANYSIGGTGSIQWSAYLAESLRLGLEFSGAFNYDTNGDVYWMVPLTVKIAHVFSLSRFEIPVSFATGVNLMAYKDYFDVLYIAKPGVGFFWRFDANLSLGINIAWWWNLEFPTDGSNWIMGNFIDASPSLYYHF